MRLSVVASIPCFVLCSFLMAEGELTESAGDIRPSYVEAESLTLPLCGKGKNGMSISAVGVDYEDRITLILKTRDQVYYRHAWSSSFLDSYPAGFDVRDIFTASGPPMTSVQVFQNLYDQFRKIGERFYSVIGRHIFFDQQHFAFMLANCEFYTLRGEPQGPRASALRFLEPDRVLVRNFSDDLPEDVFELRTYDSHSGEMVESIVVRSDPYMAAMQASLPFGESDNYIILAERNVGERPILVGLRLLQISPLESLGTLVLPYENVISTALSKPVNGSEIKISLSGYPHVVSCRVSFCSDGVPTMEIVEDCTPPAAHLGDGVSDFHYFAPWTTWIDRKDAYVLHFWNRDLGWYMLDLDPYTVFDDRFFPEYYYSSASSTLLLRQAKRKAPVYLLRLSLSR